MERCQVLSDYLVEIHKIKKDSPDLYRRRIRELLGHGECIMGLIDSYPSKLNFTTNEELESIEKRCIQWRWKLKKEANRLCQVHGDFHPWNILFNDRVELSVLDRSRGEWGEPADDVAAMTINYLFFSLQAYGSLEDPFKVLYQNFLNNYIHKTGDEEILSVIQPYYVWRALVVASPIWYPNLNYDLRRKLFNFINNLLESETLNPSRINSYLE
jgi:aminoglycoside phosphotransferase (APT) family kinase protein